MSGKTHRPGQGASVGQVRDVREAPGMHMGDPMMQTQEAAGGGNQAAVQMLEADKAGAGGEPDDESTLDTAAGGVSGGGDDLPYLDAIQQSFGRHDVSEVDAHVGGPAGEAADGIGAQAYAMGDAVAFQEAPDLHTAAHEAAHVVQQREGVSLKGGVGEAGDPYEQHADAVADKVVAGESAEGLLDQHAGGGGGGVQARAVQRRAGRGQAGAGDGQDGGDQGNPLVLEAPPEEEKNSWQDRHAQAGQGKKAYGPEKTESRADLANARSRHTSSVGMSHDWTPERLKKYLKDQSKAASDSMTNWLEEQFGKSGPKATIELAVKIPTGWKAQSKHVEAEPDQDASAADKASPASQDASADDAGLEKKHVGSTDVKAEFSASADIGWGWKLSEDKTLQKRLGKGWNKLETDWKVGGEEGTVGGEFDLTAFLGVKAKLGANISIDAVDGFVETVLSMVTEESEASAGEAQDQAASAKQDSGDDPPKINAQTEKQEQSKDKKKTLPGGFSVSGSVFVGGEVGAAAKAALKWNKKDPAEYEEPTTTLIRATTATGPLGLLLNLIVVLADAAGLEATELVAEVVFGDAGEVDLFKLSLTAKAQAGAGAGFDYKVEFKNGKVQGQFGANVTWGLGADLSTDFSADPVEIMRLGLVAADGLLEAIGDGDLLSTIHDTVQDLVGTLVPSVWTDDIARDVIREDGHKALDPAARGKLVDDILDIAVAAESEALILRLLEDSHEMGDLYEVIDSIPNFAERAAESFDNHVGRGEHWQLLDELLEFLRESMPEATEQYLEQFRSKQRDQFLAKGWPEDNVDNVVNALYLAEKAEVMPASDGGRPGSDHYMSLAMGYSDDAHERYEQAAKAREEEEWRLQVAGAQGSIARIIASRRFEADASMDFFVDPDTGEAHGHDKMLAKKERLRQEASDLEARELPQGSLAQARTDWSLEVSAHQAWRAEYRRDFGKALQQIVARYRGEAGQSDDLASLRADFKREVDAFFATEQSVLTAAFADHQAELTRILEAEPRLEDEAEFPGDSPEQQATAFLSRWEISYDQMEVVETTELSGARIEQDPDTGEASEARPQDGAGRDPSGGIIIY